MWLKAETGLILCQHGVLEYIREQCFKQSPVRTVHVS